MHGRALRAKSPECSVPVVPGTMRHRLGARSVPVAFGAGWRIQASVKCALGKDFSRRVWE